MSKLIAHGLLSLLLGGVFGGVSWAEPASAPTIGYLQDQWAQVNYQLQEKAQDDAFAQLESEATRFTAQYPDRAEGWIWSGIIKSTHAGARGGLGALKLAKAAKADLEKAMEIDSDAMSGSAYTSLGTLYFSVPGWPVGFGSDKKAEKLLLRGLELNPNGIDSNYFYAEYLREKGQLDEARDYYVKAQHAPPRSGRATADAGRQEEIMAALASLDGQARN